jgi:hypothetical protein
MGDWSINLALDPIRRRLAFTRYSTLDLTEPRCDCFGARFNFPSPAPCAQGNGRAFKGFLDFGNANLRHEVTRVALERNVECPSRVEVIRLIKIGDPHQAVNVYAMRELLSCWNRNADGFGRTVRRKQVSHFQARGAIGRNRLGPSGQDPRAR